MLSINTIKSNSQTKYYTEDEFLAPSKKAASQSNQAALTQTIAYGKGAYLLGLQGNLTPHDFEALLTGFKPGKIERIRGRQTRPDNQERLGENLTFSAPKSVSMTLHLNRDLRLFEAHTEAVKFVLDEIEQRYIHTRIRVNGNCQIVNTGNLTAALIPRHTSGDGDMQLYTHALIFNGTKRTDGQWRSLHNNALSEQQWLGSLYRQKLAQTVQDLGYEIYETQHGFELKGISPQDIQVFSKRARAIVQKLQQQGKEINPNNRDKATLTTRKAKRHDKTLEEYQQHWQTEASDHGITAPIPQNTPVFLPTQKTASMALNSAIAHLSEHSVSFRIEDIYKYVFSASIQKFELSELDQEINTNKQLLPLEQGRLTTAQTLEREINTVKQWMKGQGQATPLLSNPNLEKTKLNSGQAEAIKRTLTSTDTHQIIHGLSGVGKTNALEVLRQQLPKTGVKIKGFSPTIEAASQLQEELGIKTNTVAHLVLSQPKAEPNQLWIIDEAVMMSANQMSQIALKAESVGARILLVEDKGQNSSVEAGSPLRSLINHGATTHSISQIIRQQNSIPKQAVELIANGNGASALELLNNHGYVIEIEDRDERARTVAKQYLELSPKKRKQTLIVTDTNKERLSIIQAIRQGLKAERELVESVKAVQLVSRNLTREKSQHLNNYQIGDYLKLHRDYKGTSLQKGQLYQIEDYTGEELVVSSQGGRIYHFNPAKCKDQQVFTSQSIEIAVGDNLRWSAGADKNKGQINGKHITVVSIEDTSMTVVDERGATQSVSLLQPLPVDYNLVSTFYRARGKSKQRIIVSTANDPTSSLEPFYVKISRQTKELTVYTQNLEKLRGWVNRSSVQEL